MEDRIEIGRPIGEICALLGLEPANVAKIVFTPTNVVATVYKIRDGGKYIDEETNQPATEEKAFEVSTNEAVVG